MSLSTLLCVRFLNKETYTTMTMNAKEFKAAGMPEEKILFFCNWAGDPIDRKAGLQLYRSL